jgi:hypothetical protein
MGCGFSQGDFQVRLALSPRNRPGPSFQARLFIPPSPIVRFAVYFHSYFYLMTLRANVTWER